MTAQDTRQLGRHAQFTLNTILSHVKAFLCVLTVGQIFERHLVFNSQLAVFLRNFQVQKKPLNHKCHSIISFLNIDLNIKILKKS